MIQIDAVGLHPSTLSCLEVLEWLHEREQFNNILEIGCGSGVLSVVSAGVWDAKVLAADISEKAISDCVENIKTYGLESHVTAIRSDGCNHKEIEKSAPYDLIICNLLAELHARIAPDIKKHCKTNGYLLLSGILAWKAAEVESAYLGLGFDIVRKIESSPWNSYVFCNTTDTIKKPPFTKA